MVGLPRHVLFVVPRFHTNLHGAVRALTEAGVAATVWATDALPLEDYTHATPRLFGPEATGADIARALDETNPDLILLRRAKPLSPLVARAARRLRIALWHYSQMPLTEHRSAWLRWRDRARGVPIRRVTPVPGPDPAALPDRYARLLPWPVYGTPAPVPRSNGALRILCVGKLAQPRKNQHLLLAALDALPGAPDWTLTLAGSSTDRARGADGSHAAALRDRAARDGRVRLRPDLPFADMPALYAAHDICVLPSVREVLGVAPLEAMAFGCVPVIAADAGAAGHVTDGIDGVRVDMADPDALTRALAGLLSDPARLTRLGAAAAVTAHKRFGPDAFLAALSDLAL